MNIFDMQGKINLYKANGGAFYYRFRTKHEFFNQSLLWHLDESYLILIPAGLDDRKSNCITPRMEKHANQYVFGLNLEEIHPIPNGDYTFDEDSTEDELIIYLG